jgi:hypothetical protein
MSCSQTSEIFDDAYDEAKAPPKVNLDDQAGYADYIKNQEDIYDVEVDTNRYENKTLGGNPSYYGPGTNQYSYNNGANNRPYDYYGISPNAGFNNGNNGNFGCQYGCMSYNTYGTCWHMNNGGNCNSNWGYNGSVACGTNHTHNPYNTNYYGNNNCGNNGYYGNSGYGNNYYGNGYGNTYGNGYGNYYGNNYYGSNYYGGYNNYNGGLFGSSWGFNNNSNIVANGGDSNVGTNHHNGHRGGTSYGGNSGNTTVYEHTVKTVELTSSTPFPAYSSNQTVTTTYTSVTPKPVVGTIIGSGAKVDKTNPTSNTVKPVKSNMRANYTAERINPNGIVKAQPAGNRFEIGTVSRGEGNTTTSKGYSTGTYGRNNNTAVGNTNSTGSSGNSNPNKYGNRTNPNTTQTSTGNSNNTSTGRNNNSNSNYSGNRPGGSNSSNGNYTGSRNTNSGSTGTSNTSGTSSRGGSTTKTTTTTTTSGRKR